MNTLTHLHGLIEDVRAGRLTRRGFVVHTGRIGLSLPMAGMLLHAGVASSQPAPAFKPTRRGGGGVLRFLQVEGPTLLNPHFAAGMKDVFACRVFHEPLAQWDADANLQPILAAETPTRDNGGLAADGKSVLWRLKRDVLWHDGSPFTADDVIFNWQYATDRAGATVSAGSYANLRMEKVDSHTVRVAFDRPSPFWPGQYASVLLIAQHVFKAYTGARSREAPANLKPVGTGAYVHVDFTPGDRWWQR